jgi:hypothetical protein
MIIDIEYLLNEKNKNNKKLLKVLNMVQLISDHYVVTEFLIRRGKLHNNYKFIPKSDIWVSIEIRELCEHFSIISDKIQKIIKFYSMNIMRHIEC